jgi:trk system potassium uptake protein TrkA
VQIIVVGGGQVGTTLAGKLSREGHDVTVIERQSALADELSSVLDVRVIHGDGATVDTLRRAGAADANLVVASTDSDEANFISGRIAASIFKVPRVVVRLREPAHAESFEALSRSDAVDIAWVNPESAAVDKIALLLEVPGALDVANFMDGELIVAGFPIAEGSEFTDRPVLDMGLFFAGSPSLVAAIQRREGAIVPQGGEVIRVGDLVYFALARSDLSAVLDLLGAQQGPSRKVMVAGASRIGLALAERLEGADTPVTLIESDPERARAAAEGLTEALVIRGRVTSQPLLEEEQIERVSTFVAVTDDHETNLVAGLLAKRLGAQRAFALVDNPALANLIGDTPIDAIISPRLLAVGLTLQHVPGARLHAVAALQGDEVEILEAEVVKGSPVCVGPLADLNLPRGILFLALRRSGSLRVPKGGDQMEPGDRVLVAVGAGQRAKLSELLSV